MQELPLYNDTTLSNVIYVIVDLFYDYRLQFQIKTKPGRESKSRKRETGLLHLPLSALY